MTTQNAGTVRHKTFEYSVSTFWRHDRQGTIASEGKPLIDVASPPEFKGVPGVWSPEDLFVAAVDVCQMTTFLALATRAGLPLRSYTSSARGRLEFADGGYRFTKVVLAPRIVVGPGTEIAAVERLVENAHRMCIIGRSIQPDVSVQPTITAES